MRTQITDLAKRLKRANEAYRNGNPIMSDAAYDKLEDDLRALDPGHSMLAKIGAPAPSGGHWPKAAHVIPMGSLKKCQFNGNSAHELRAWMKTLPHPHSCTISQKLDGISCFDGDTPVHLANGETIPIQQIVDEGLRPQVLTWTPQEGVVTRQVTNAFDNGERDNWVRLTFEDGTSVVVTEDHEFYAKNCGLTPAKDLLGMDLQNHNE